MANVSVVFARPMQGIAQVISAESTAAEAMTSSGTSAQSTATASVNDICRVITDGAIWIAFGDNPTAVAGSGHYIPANAGFDYGNLQHGWKVAVIDA